MTDMTHREMIPEKALEWHQAGKGAIIATVVETWGSAPRRIGGQLVVSGSGEMEGSVSGGCVEGAVICEALEALEGKTSKLLEYGVSDGDAFAVGLACGGTIRVLLEPIGAVLPEEMLAQTVELRKTRVAFAYVVNVRTGERRLERDGFKERLRLDRSGLEEDQETFVGVHNPPLRLVIVGGVHIAQSLSPMARLAGFEPIIVDPREGFGSADRFPGDRIINEWPDEALAQIGRDSRTALVLLTHDPKLDDPALEFGLGSEYFYIGALGSKRTHAKRVERFEKKGYSQDQIGRICGPVGLNIGSATPAEIAVSILAQMVEKLRTGP